MHCYWVRHATRRPRNSCLDQTCIGVFFVRDEARRQAINTTFGVCMPPDYIGKVVRLSETAGRPFIAGASNFYGLYIGR